MTVFDADPRFDDDDDEDWVIEEGFALGHGLAPEPTRRALAPGGLDAGERWLFYERLWSDVCHLRDRFHLPVRTNWWSDAVQLETLAALAAWVERYDSGEWEDPPGKLALLFDLERVGTMLRDGNDPFFPDRDRETFNRFLAENAIRPSEA